MSHNGWFAGILPSRFDPRPECIKPRGAPQHWDLHLSAQFRLLEDSQRNLLLSFALRFKMLMTLTAVLVGLTALRSQAVAAPATTSQAFVTKVRVFHSSPESPHPADLISSISSMT